MTQDAPPLTPDSPAFVSRHIVGIAMILGSALTPVAQRLADPSPLSNRSLAEMAVACLIAACTTITAYRAVPNPK